MTLPHRVTYNIFANQCLPYGEHGTHDIHKGIEDAIGILEAAENYAKTLWMRDTMK